MLLYYFLRSIHILVCWSILRIIDRGLYSSCLIPYYYLQRRGYIELVNIWLNLFQDAIRCFTRRKSREKWVKSRSKPEIVTLLTIRLQITQVRKPLEFLRIYGLFVAGAEGIEPSAYGFGGLHGLPLKRLITGHNSYSFFALRCIKMFGEQMRISMHKWAILRLSGICSESRKIFSSMY